MEQSGPSTRQNPSRKAKDKGKGKMGPPPPREAITQSDVMSSSFTLHCIAVNDENDPIGGSFHVKVSSGQLVSGLQEDIKAKNSHQCGHVDANELTLWKLMTRQPTYDYESQMELMKKIQGFQFPSLTSHGVDQGNGLIQPLHPNKRIDQCWTCDPIGDDLHLIVQVPYVEERPRKKPRLQIEDLSPTPPLTFGEIQDIDARKAIAHPTPSSGAKMPFFIQEQKNRPLLNGRPINQFGPPIGLFHPVFNSFQAAMASKERVRVDRQAHSNLRKLLASCADLYTLELPRVKTINIYLNALLGASLTSVSVPHTSTCADGVILQNSCNSYAYLVIEEVKNEIGTGNADPYTQASLSYVAIGENHLVRDIFRRCSYCPSIILAIAGPWMCVAGGIYLDKAIVQPLTEYIWLGGDAFKESRFDFTLRLFAALKSAISTLQDYYGNLNPSNEIPRHLHHAFPFVTSYGTQSFEYLMPLVDYQRGKLVYKAQLHESGQLIVVKFVSIYNAEAHRLLASNQLAPPLDRAVQLLHQQNFVFGDLRTPNLLISGEKVMLIDFDWCGTADESLYPSTLNTDSGIQWPDGVWPGEVMRKEDDVTMLERLRPVTHAEEADPGLA
ncbi:hypothetical protein B0F90DRAFT_1820992 [Multifurca ochricompacta]|uniref:Crinkler effector protein N-terminal domain-containing protein n=1 Tax=Multifurca ochricompacta TaxID=376703 RepID=A0AAD4LXY0_9AGAM|nr:hypothetical protein B0F90DRAFT_1820992 [Multifurca ochricompacta]